MRIVFVLLLTLFMSGALHAEERAHKKRMFWMSVAAVGISAALDLHSSWGKPELNPLVRSANGRLGMRGVGIKFATGGGVVGLGYLLVRKYPELDRTMSMVNFAVGATWTGVAVRNYGIERPPALPGTESGPMPIGMLAAAR